MNSIKTNLILTGMRGAGKTTIGINLSKKSDCWFIDLDNLIESLSKESIENIFKNHGEFYFRKIESNIIEQIYLIFSGKTEHLEIQKLLPENFIKKPGIISIGGGAVLTYKNRQFLNKIGNIVYIKASLSTLLKRSKKTSQRPSIKGLEWEKEIEILLNERKKIYEDFADYIVDSDEKEVENIVDELKHLWRTF